MKSEASTNNDDGNEVVSSTTEVVLKEALAKTNLTEVVKTSSNSSS